jgi:hypothetical protein
MTALEQQIAIAKLCGYIPIYSDGEFVGWFNGRQVGNPPDYMRDLNAMHKIELGMNEDLKWRYTECLARVLASQGADIEWEDHQGVCNAVVMISATAGQRAEAFLRTIDKWEDAPEA